MNTRILSCMALAITGVLSVSACASSAKPVSSDTTARACIIQATHGFKSDQLEIGVVGIVKPSVSTRRLNDYELENFFAKYSACIEEYRNIHQGKTRKLEVLFYGRPPEGNCDLLLNGLKLSGSFPKIHV